MRNPVSATRSLPTLSIVFLSLVLVVSALMLTQGRELSHRLTLSMCTDVGDCGSFPESPPVCEYYGRDRVAARESFAFAQQQPADSARLIQFGDDSAEVVVSRSDDDTDIYSFLRWQDAQRWVLDHSAELGGVADAAAGPSGQPIRDGYFRMLRLIGLDHEISFEPNATVHNVDDPTGPGTHGVVRRSSQGDIEEVTVVMPLERATTELQTFADELGFWGFISYTVELGANLEPQRLTFGGPAAEDWSLEQLHSPSSRVTAADSHQTPSYVDDGQSVLRSFVLDLTTLSNATLYRDIFAMESLAGTAAPLLTAEEWLSAGERDERYSQALERIQRDAVTVETTHALPGRSASEDQVLQAVEGLVKGSATVNAPQTRLVDARSADLSVSGSSFGPLLSCAAHDEDADQEVEG